MVIVYLSDKSDDDETPKRSPDTKKNDEEDENKKSNRGTAVTGWTGCIDQIVNPIPVVDIKLLKRSAPQQGSNEAEEPVRKTSWVSKQTSKLMTVLEDRRLSLDDVSDDAGMPGVANIHTVPSIAMHQAVLEAKQSIAGPKAREQWGSQLQFLLACVGYVVGLGNIWRFPSLAYEHGGGAFLIPYVVCSLLFGVPVVLLEQAMGQFTQAGPSVGFAYYAPICQGVGWAMASVGATVGMYYNVVVAWSMIYLYKIVTGSAWEWSSCRNLYNTLNCESSLEDERCLEASNGSLGYFFNGSCIGEQWRGILKHPNGAVSPAEEFFENYVTLRSHGMEDIGGMNWKVFFALFFVWTVVAAVMSRGVKYIGRLAYFTATVPYLIIAAFFIRGITLDGADEGLNFYILEPDFRYIFYIETWKAALTQCCFSLSIGFGGILAMSSYNGFKHKCFKDVLILVGADNFMNFFGGTAVFSVLGFLAKQLGKPLSQVIQSGTSLAFVAYPEAISRMPLPSLWAFMFFFMLVVLGLTTTFGYVQVMTTCLRDEFSSLYSRRTLITFITAAIFFTGGIVICTKAGLYWFIVFNDFTGSTCICAIGLIELILLVHWYGLKNVVTDFRLMFGFPQNRMETWFGATGNLMQLAWLIVSPLMAATVLVSTFIREPLTYGKGNRVYQFPWWASLVGWLLVLIPTACIPAFAITNTIRFKRAGKDLSELFKIQPSLRSYNRIHGIEEKRKVTPYPVEPEPRDERMEEFHP